MTALKPLENRRTRGVASERYPLNTKCAHPDCNEDAQDPHHLFPRSSIGNDSWFVQIIGDCRNDTDGDGNCPTCAGFHEGLIGTPSCRAGLVIPHVTGLCRAHHDDAELHSAWIKLEDGVFVWYDRAGEPSASEDYRPLDAVDAAWTLVGPLDPQPAGREKAHKPKRKCLKGEARRARTTISIKVPKDEAEDGAGVLFDLIETLEAKLGHDPARPVYYTIADALSYAVLNSDESDFR